MNDFIDLRRVFVIILRKWWMLALAIVIGAGLGYGVAKRQAKVYQATTTLLVGQIVSSTDLNRQDILAGDLMAKTYREMIMREPVLQGVVDALDLNLTWQQLSKRIKVDLVEGTQLIQITAEANSPDSASIVADEVAQQLILFSPTVLQGQGNDSVQPFVQQQLNSLQSRIESGQNRLAALETEMQSTDSTERLTELQAEANGLESLITDWENNYTQLLAFLQSGQSINQLAVVEAARANPNPIRPQVQIYVLVATALAIFLTLALIFTLDYFNNTVRDPEEITREFGLPVLGTIDDTRHYGENKKSVYASKFLVSPIAEAYRSLRANLEVVGAGKEVKSILITSADSGVGKSSISANLAAFLAQAGKRVILVDADLRKSGLHELMGLQNSVGLRNIISDGVSISKALQPPKGDGLRVITAGTSPSQTNGTGQAKKANARPMMLGETPQLEPSEILGSEKVDNVLTKLEADSDIVIIDSPPFIVSDALILASKVDGVLLVIQPGRTLRKSIHNMMEQLNRADAKVIGVVLNYITPANARKMIGLPYPSIAHAAEVQPADAGDDEKEHDVQDASRSKIAVRPFTRASLARHGKGKTAGEGTGVVDKSKNGRIQDTAGQLEGSSALSAGAAVQTESASEQIEGPPEPAEMPGVQAGEIEAQNEDLAEPALSLSDQAAEIKAQIEDIAEPDANLSAQAAEMEVQIEELAEPAESPNVAAGDAEAQIEDLAEPTESPSVQAVDAEAQIDELREPAEPEESLGVEAGEIEAQTESAVDIVAGDGFEAEQEGANAQPQYTGDLTDEQWKRVRPMLPPQKPRADQAGLDDRTILDGILWIQRTGSRWRTLPERYGKHETVYSRYRRLRQTGAWERIWDEVGSSSNQAENEGKDGDYPSDP